VPRCVLLGCAVVPPGWTPPIQLSSTSMVPRSLVRLVFTVARRSLWRIIGGRLVAGDSELALEGEGREAALVGDHQVGRPEPDHQGCPGSMEDGSGGRGCLVAAGGTFPEPAGWQGPGCPMAAPGAREAVGPAALGEIRLARLIRREPALEVEQGLRKAGATGGHASTLHVVATGGNGTCQAR
jgi:hypothetical protein